MQARRLPARQGLQWLVAGFGLLRRNPPLLVSLTLAYWLMFAWVLQVAPAVGSFLLPGLLPVATLVVANGYRAVAEGKSWPLPKGTLFIGVRRQNRALWHLCGLNLLGSLLIVLISTLLLGDAFDNPDVIKDDPAGLLLLLGELLIISSPLLLAFWFSPLLTGWDGVPAIKSLFFSLAACLRNWPAFTVYGLAAAALAVVVPGLLMAVLLMVIPDGAPVLFTALRMAFLILLAPALMAGAYLGYRDIFRHD